MPLWLGPGLGHPSFTWIALAMMITPSIAAVVVAALERTLGRFFADVGMWPVHRPWRFITAMLLGILIPVFLIIQAVFVGSWIGVFPGDLQNFTILKIVSGEAGVGRYLVDQGGLILVAGLVNLLPALGEEVGWRGWLWPRLQPLGQLPAILISGVVWGLWHAPLILLGYNYPLADGPWGVMSMCGMCIVVGAFFAWLRSFSQSVWPAAFAHAIFNASAGLVSLFMVMGPMLDTQKASILGWSGWILPTALITVMLFARVFHEQEKPEVSTVRSVRS
ncbi:CPBP family intramembrane glutamic endopeptidase [Glutamicibacter protophormiae]|uniref:CPBP family intramembrane glutamic endopeptidase n=1 Tax=Glutamicibacter protophormiae TaxID=37930 RepID=UPI003A8D87B3